MTLLKLQVVRLERQLEIPGPGFCRMSSHAFIRSSGVSWPADPQEALKCLYQRNSASLRNC